MTAILVERSSVDTSDYEPFSGFDAVLDGDPAAQVAWLRTSSGGPGVLYAGMFTAAPSRFRYTFGGDESLHVLNGDVEIEVDGGPAVRLGPGEIASFPKGVSSTWTVHRALRKFFVISG
ncbi:MAG TPA: cupin domain-containing protein [Nocardioides sp.]|jgi:hypothetical protein